MKLVREHINKFERGLDPKEAMDIGLLATWRKLIRDFIQHFRYKHLVNYKEPFKINDFVFINGYMTKDEIDYMVKWVKNTTPFEVIDIKHTDANEMGKLDHYEIRFKYKGK